MDETLNDPDLNEGEFDEVDEDLDPDDSDLDDEFEDGFLSDLDESMDGDLESGLASAGYGTDEDYNHYSYDDGFSRGDEW